MSRIATAITALSAALFPIAAPAGAQPSVPGSAILTAPGNAGDARWHWIEVEPSRGSETGWVTMTGSASVHIAGRHFTAELKIGRDQQGADISLAGRIAGGRITARETLLDTDARPAAVHGEVMRRRIGNIVEERIALSGGQMQQASFLGLYRRVPRSARR